MLSARKIALLGVDSPMVAMLCATDGFVSSATIPVPLPLPAPPIYLGGGGGSGMLWMPTWPAPISSNWWKRPEDLIRELEEQARAEQEAQQAQEASARSKNSEHVVADTIFDSHGIERQVRIRYDDSEKDALKDKGTDWLAERVITLEGKELARESALNWTVTNGQRTFRLFVHKPYVKDDNPAFPQAKMLPSILVSVAAFALMWAAGHD